MISNQPLGNREYVHNQQPTDKWWAALGHSIFGLAIQLSYLARWWLREYYQQHTTGNDLDMAQHLRMALVFDTNKLQLGGTIDFHARPKQVICLADLHVFWFGEVHEVHELVEMNGVPMQNTRWVTINSQNYTA